MQPTSDDLGTRRTYDILDLLIFLWLLSEDGILNFYSDSIFYKFSAYVALASTISISSVTSARSFLMELASTNHHAQLDTNLTFRLG